MPNRIAGRGYICIVRLPLRDPAWRDWYYSQHESRARASGEAFEEYVEDVLSRFHPDFINPQPAGSHGDGGADGLADTGRILYACYGSRATQDAERKLARKIESDFVRAHSQWPDFREWRFVTNAPVGPLATRTLTSLQQVHEHSVDRPIRPRLWTPEHLWREVVGNLEEKHLNDVFPGVPRAEHVELEDLIPLLDFLGSGTPTNDECIDIRPVSDTKMEFNNLPLAAKVEFNEGRLLAPSIGSWFERAFEPEIEESSARAFRDIYIRQREVATNSRELLERVYTSLGGSDFRHDSKRATAVYAVTAYFFDACRIFEDPTELDFAMESDVLTK